MSNRGGEEKGEVRVSATIKELLLAARARNERDLKTGRYIITFRKGAVEEGIKSLVDKGFRVIDSLDSMGHVVTPKDLVDVDALVFSGIRSAVVSSSVQQEYGTIALGDMISEGSIETIEPEYFVFADNSEYFRGFVSAANTIAKDLRAEKGAVYEEEEVSAQNLDATWGLIACNVPYSPYGGSGVKVAVLDTGLDLQHPSFFGRSITFESFVGGGVYDSNGHGTHVTGTACGPRGPLGPIHRYGIAYDCQIFVGKVVADSAVGTTSSVLNGMNWAINNNCRVINVSLCVQSPVQNAYTTAGLEALNKMCLIIAAAGNEHSYTGAPANSPNIMSVASLDQTLRPSSFSNYGKIEIAAPGNDVYSSLPGPRFFGIKSGTSMATPHVAGCAAIRAQSRPDLHGRGLWRALLRSVTKLNSSPTEVGSGLVRT